MSIWKAGTKKSKRVAPPAPPRQETIAAPNEAASVLPDVVAGLSFGIPTTSPRIGSSTMGMMKGFTSPLEVPEGRREPRPRGSHHPQPHTSHGLGAAASFVPQQCYELTSQIPPQETCPKREEVFPFWTEHVQQVSQHSSEFPSQANNASSIFVQESSCSTNNELVTIQDVRLRSMSSDPHGGHRQGRNREQRARCSSATRNRQPRPRTKYPVVEEATSIQNPLLYSNVEPEPIPQMGSCGIAPEPNPLMNTCGFARIDYQENSPAQHQAEGGIQNQRKSKHVQEDPAHVNNGMNENVSEQPPQPNRNVQSNSYGYQIPDLDALLSEASSNRPANLPMVLASPSRLHNMRKTQENQGGPIRPFLPLGIIVNAVFKTRDWLYIRTAHGAEGYVPFRVCLPLGILPQNRGNRGPNSAAPSLPNNYSPWELRGDESISSPSRQAVKVPPPNTVDPVTTLQRGRQRERRRVFDDSNQTDMQKLLPDSTISDAQGIELRLNTSRGCNIPHFV